MDGDDESVPYWMRPDGGLTALDMDHLPETPRQTELIDGGLVFQSPQNRFHMQTVTHLVEELGRSVPPQWRVRRAMSVILGDRQRPDPDVSIIDSSFRESNDTTWYPASAVLLVAEVVMPDTQIRDRERKPQLYARAGIEHYWRVEGIDGRPVAYVFQLDPARVPTRRPASTAARSRPTFRSRSRSTSTARKPSERPFLSMV